METLLQDIRYGVRSMLKHRTLTILAIVTLALGIGAVIGLAGAFALTRLLASLLFGVFTDGRPEIHAGGDCVVGYCTARLLHPGAARNESRSVGGVKVRMKTVVQRSSSSLCRSQSTT